MSSFGNIFKIFKYIPLLASLIKDVEAVMGKGNGANKKQAVVDAFEKIIEVAAPIVEASNPAYAALISEVVDFLVLQLNRYAGLSDPVPAPAPAPAADPTAKEYDTLDEAKVALAVYGGVNYPNVIRRADGKYSIYPAIGPYPGELVYPA